MNQVDLDWLVGRRVFSVERKNDVSGEDTYRFHTEGGTLVVGCEADCCSESWFEHDTGFDAIVGEVVTSAEQVPMSQAGFKPEDGYQGGQESLETYSFVIKSAKGYAEIELRNSSNGYYGGWLSCRIEP